ncbi:MAG: TetR/AcrR family transcriptional regulator [Acidimicrobiales bacterium]
MSPKAADPTLRAALIDAAARLIAEEGSNGLSLRRLANEVGTSTMAIYTHFGSMEEVRRAVRREGFARLAAHLATVEESGDTVADLLLLGLAYHANAVENPNLYRAMFMEHVIDVADSGAELETFERLVTSIHRCIKAGRFDEADPIELAIQTWAMSHGIASLQIAGYLDADQAMRTLAAAGLALIRAFGDDPQARGRSLATTRRRMGLPGAGSPS